MALGTAILLGAASLLVASFACTGADSKLGALTPVPREQSVPTVSKADVTLSTTVPGSNSNVGASFSVDDKQEPSVAAPIHPKPGAGKDLTDAQHRTSTPKSLRCVGRPTSSESAPGRTAIAFRPPVQPGKSSVRCCGHQLRRLRFK